MKEEEQGEGEELGKIFLSYSSHWLGTLINEPSDVAPEIRAGEQHQRHIPNDPHCPCSCPILSWCHTVQQKRNPDPSPFREKEQWDGHFQEYLETYTGLGTTTMGIDQATCPVALDIIQDIFRTNLFPNLFPDLLSQSFRSQRTHQITVSWFRNSILQFSIPTETMHCLFSPSLSPCGWLKRRIGGTKLKGHKLN